MTKRIEFVDYLQNVVDYARGCKFQNGDSGWDSHIDSILPGLRGVVTLLLDAGYSVPSTPYRQPPPPPRRPSVAESITKAVKDLSP